MIVMGDVYRVIDEERQELVRQIRAQAEVMDLDDSQMKGMDDLFTIIDQYGKAVLARLEDIEIERLDKMSEDLVDDYGCYDDIIHNAELEQEFEITERGYGRKIFEEGEE